jgi:hypothetical protein
MLRLELLEEGVAKSNICARISVMYFLPAATCDRPLALRSPRNRSMTPDSTTRLKTCTNCGRQLPATVEYFYPRKAGKDGLLSQCRECQRERSCRYYTEHVEQVRERVRRYRAEHVEQVREKDRRYYTEHAEQVRESQRRYRAEHIEQVREKERRYRVEHVEQVREKKRRYRAEHIEQVREKDRRYYAQHPEQKRAQINRRRARRLAAEGTHTAEDVQAQYGRQKGKCFWCGAKLNGKYHADHVIPLVRGGTNWPSNIVCACAVCNTSKQDKLPHEWSGTDRLL